MYGRRASGSFDIRKIDGTKVRAAISFKKLKFLEARKNFLITKEGIGAIPHIPKDMGILAQEL